MPTTLSAAQARRVALAAQGFARPAPSDIGARQLGSVIRALGLLQLDSVNVFERSHYLPLFARLGGYDRALLDELVFRRAGRRARYFEYWAHEAALLPIEMLPLMRWRMRAHRAQDEGDPNSWANANGPMLDWLRAELAARGPLAASEIEHPENTRTGPWWGWSSVKRGLEVLFRWGEVFSAGRTRFERRYGLPEHVLPPGALDVEPPRADAIRELVAHASRAHGVGTVNDIADYFRLRSAETATALQELVETGTVELVEVRGWGRPAFLHRQARIAQRIDSTALLSPFDPVVWFRDRAERIFDFRYRIEIYTPKEKRVYGYYTLPVLIDDRLPARIDLKSDRTRGVLRAQSAWREADAANGIEERIAPLLRDAAAWQGLDEIEVVDRGTLARDLAGALGVRALNP